MGESRLGLLIASPPCQAWSMAGKRKGLKDQARVLDLCSTWAADPSAPRPGGWHDERSPLAAEPMRWASALRPALMAWEQVPPVLDLWSHCARLLRVMGYSTWTGILSAERYGVPQTRKRAILLASLAGQPAPPRPTHQRYVPGEPARHEVTLEGEILPWVSMAEALGWDAGERGFDRRQGRTQADGSRRMSPVRPDSDPAPTVDGIGMAKHRNVWRLGFPRNADDGEATPEGHRARDFRDQDEPALTVTEKARSAVKMRRDSGPGAERDPRPTDAPSYTIRANGSGKAPGGVVWVNGNQPNAARRDEGEPAPTVHFGHNVNRVEWVEERPATRRGSPDDYDAEGNYTGKRSMDNAVRVSIAEAAILQSFDPAYPWQGSRTAIFTQIGNAVPPLLARAILESLTEGVEIGTDALDLFAGPGGWDCGARDLGIDPLGIELDPTACKTRVAAGLRTLCGDVAQLDPASFADVAMEAA